MELTKIILEEDEIPLVRTKNFEKISYVKGYHAYKDLWIPVKGEYLRCEREPDNVMDKYSSLSNKRPWTFIVFRENFQGGRSY